MPGPNTNGFTFWWNIGFCTRSVYENTLICHISPSEPSPEITLVGMNFLRGDVISCMRQVSGLATPDRGD